MNNIKTGLLISALRKSKGLTQQDLSIELGVTSKTVSKWECGDALPEIPTLVLLGEFFDITVDELLKGERTRSSKNTKDDTESRFQSKKDRFMIQKLLSKITTLYWISIGLLIASIIFMFFFGGSTLVVLFIFGIIFGISSFVLFMIANHSEVYEDDTIHKDLLLKVDAAKFKFKYIYINIIVLVLTLLTLFARDIVLISLYFYPIYLFVIYVLYYDMRNKRYGDDMPYLASKIIHINHKIKLLYLVVLVAFGLYTFLVPIYNYNVNVSNYHITFIDVFLDQSLIYMILFSAFFVISILLYIYNHFKHKTYKLEWFILTILGIVSAVTSAIHYDDKLILIHEYPGSHGYSGLDFQLVMFVILFGILYLIFNPLIKKMSLPQK